MLRTLNRTYWQSFRTRTDWDRTCSSVQRFTVRTEVRDRTSATLDIARSRMHAARVSFFLLYFFLFGRALRAMVIPYSTNLKLITSVHTLILLLLQKVR